jgi:membrane-bound ClpP family serine protease
MKLSAPKFSTWLISVIVGLVGILQHFHVLHINDLAQYSVHLIIIGFALLVLATLVRKL